MIKRICRLVILWIGMISLLFLMPIFTFAAETPELFVQTGHSSDINSACFSSDGKYLISAGEDKTIKLWEVATGREVKTFRHNREITSVVFSPDNRKILFGDKGGRINFWDVQTGKALANLKHPGVWIKSIALSPDGKHALAAGEKLSYFDISAKKKIFEVNKDSYQVSSAAFLRDGKFIAMGVNVEKDFEHQSSKIDIFDIVKRKNINSFILSKTERIESIAISPDEKHFLAGMYFQNKKGDGKEKLLIVSAETGKIIQEFPFRYPVSSVAFSVNGKYAAAGAIGKTLILDAENWNIIQKNDGGSPVVFSPDSRHLAYEKKEDNRHGLNVIDLTSWKRIVRLSGSAANQNSSLFGLKEGELLTLNHDITYWDVNRGMLKNHSMHLKGSANEELYIDSVSKDGKYALMKNMKSESYLFDFGTNNLEKMFVADLRYADFNPDNRYLLFSTYSDKIVLWDLKRKVAVKTLFDKGNNGQLYIGKIGFSPDGQYAFATYSDLGKSLYVIKLWDVSTAREIKTFEIDGNVYTVAISPDSRYVLSGEYSGMDRINHIILREITSGRINKFKGHIDSIYKVAFSHDGEQIISGGVDQNVILWDTKSGKRVKTFQGHAGTISSLTFSPDDKLVVSTSDDGTTRLWDISTGKEIAQFVRFVDGEWIVITPEGYFNASPGGAKHLNVRVGNKVYSIDNFYEKFFNPVYVASVLQGKKVEAVADIRKGVLSPPDIRITSPAPGKEFNTDTLTVTVAAKDTGGGIDEIRLYHNGKAIGEDTRAVKIVSRGSETIREYAVSLVDGVNTFRAVGFSKDRTESNPYELIVKLTAPSKDVSLYVLAVGINKYKNPALNLNYAEPDAQGLADFFKRQGKGLFKNVDIREIYNEQATKENIVSGLNQLKNINPQDAVIIYLAGHGENIKEKWYFIPHELTYPEREEDVKIKGISSDELSGYTKNIKAQKILLLIDACKSGAVLIAFRGFEDRKALSQLSRSTGVHVVAASTKDQFATEVKDLGHGVFTYTLLEGLGGKAAGKGEAVTVRKLMGYVEENLPEITKKYKQEAQYPVMDSQGMDFPLVIAK